MRSAKEHSAEILVPLAMCLEFAQAYTMRLSENIPALDLVALALTGSFRYYEVQFL